MQDRLERLRLAFPAEVTAAFLAAQKILNGPNDVNATNFDFAMVTFLAALLLINLMIYIFSYRVTSWMFLIYVSFGFILWSITIDSQRLKDLLPFPYYPAVPLLLVLYNLVSIYIPLPNPPEQVPAETEKQA